MGSCICSDLPSPTVACVAENIGPPTNAYESVELVSNSKAKRKSVYKNGEFVNMVMMVILKEEYLNQ